MEVSIGEQSALIVVDVQNDFCPGGALPVPEGDRVVPVLNRYIDRFAERGRPIYYTRDWHPENHCSFKDQGGIWPPHCIKETEGAAFHPQLKILEQGTVVSKGEEPDQEAYSGFMGTNVADRLKQAGIERVFVGGLATDYCVKHTTLDALKHGFVTVLLTDASLGVDVNPGDSEAAIREMEGAGAKKVTVDELD